MATKDFTMREHNGTGWDEKHPKTNTGQVVGLPDLIDARVQALINGAPAALDTLKELADALGNDKDFAATVTAALAGKVDKATGKQLTTEDFTAALKSKLEGIAAGATKVTSPSDIGAAASTHTHTKSQISDFPSSMPASDVSAWAKAAAKPTYTAAEVGAVPTTRKVNNKALSADITLGATDVGAAPTTHSHGATDLTVPVITVSATAPTNPKVGDIWFDTSGN